MSPRKVVAACQSLSAPTVGELTRCDESTTAITYMCLIFQVAVKSYYLETKLWRFARLCPATLIDLAVFHLAKNNLALGAEIDKIIG